MEQDPRFQSRDILAVAGRRAARDANVAMLIRRLEALLAERKRLRPNIVPPDPGARLAARLAGPWPVGPATDIDIDIDIDTEKRLRIVPRDS